MVFDFLVPLLLNTAHSAGSTWFASEMKALSDDCERFMSFLPGHIYSSKNGMFYGTYSATYFSASYKSIIRAINHYYIIQALFSADLVVIIVTGENG